MSAPPSYSSNEAQNAASQNERVLWLYVAGQSQRSLIAFDKLIKLCAVHLPGQYRIEVIDLLENPPLSRDDQIVAVPTVYRKLPVPIRKVIGDLSNTERTLVGLQLRPVGPRKVTAA